MEDRYKDDRVTWKYMLHASAGFESGPEHGLVVPRVGSGRCWDSTAIQTR
jgi:hypothetical protein